LGTGHDHAASVGSNRRALRLALAVTGSFLLFEAAGGWLTGSLALVADAGHMLTDVAAIALSLFAITIAARPATHARTYGFKRVEILAAAVNGVALIVIAVYIAWEAIQRLDDPAEVKSVPMLAVAIGGLLCNLVAMRLLAPGREANLNMRGAFVHVLGDLLGSVGAIVAALIILATGWTRADPLISLAIAGLIVFSAGRLIRESLDVLLEATPAGLDVGAMEAALTTIRGVRCVHDIHVWTVTSGFVAMSGHIEIEDQADYAPVMIAAHAIVRERYGIAHCTLQLETPDLEARLPDQHLPGDQPCLPGHVQAEMVAHPH
jgi:cobalt-zinc-cadmium efflux system protein